ncbi:MAG: bifunctional phosphoribosyl-AMP cyclohydrolase/phosphoribosyl-ATP diphosphatase HisIE [Chloroflexota bacterium]|nr:bifunctional phosphoribosyl-AMP cyclohydrolase/phosphoribosyl-ATP diphosphatase HisIE [Chloroflexota bacterium]|tara:strand:+ start:164 stop:766 length:603 start_codon:yes stop_codon:yes gene_type:complete
MSNSDVNLIPAIIQDINTKEVLMLGYMNSEALKKTLEGPNVWFYSRSRQKLWEKGETSGNHLILKNITTDCDKDTLLIQVEPSGPSCHTGENSCFHQPELKHLAWQNPNIFSEVFNIIEDRKNNPKEKSYVNSLLTKGDDHISQKVIEELCEAIVEFNSDNKERMIEETADLIFHIFALMSSKSINLNDIENEFIKRKKH